MLTRRRLLHTLPVIAGALWSCENEPPPSRYRLPKKPLTVFTSTSQVADLIRAIGGEAVTVTSFIPPLANPHLWQPLASDYAQLQLADVFFLSGLGLEAKFTADLDVLRGRGLHVGVLSDGLSKDDILIASHETPDPHFWMDPRLWAKAAFTAADVLSAAYPKAALWFSDRGHEYANDLLQIHSFASKEFLDLSASARFLFTSHDSMGYFASAYGLQVRTLASSTGVTPTPFPEDLIRWLSENNLKTLFRESLTDLKTIKSIARPLNLICDPQIYSLSLGLPGTILPGIAGEMDVSTFLVALRYTIDTILSHLRNH